MNSQARDQAISNVYNIISSDARFPKAVFTIDNARFFFFDSDWLFDSEFVGLVRQLLDIENAQCTCVIDLDAHKGTFGSKDSAIVIDRTSNGLNYIIQLKGSGPEDGWIYSVNRFGCASNVGNWCIYCERASELAVIALRESVRFENYDDILQRLKAMPIEKAITNSLCYGFSQRALSSEWRDQLLSNYEHI
jgi:hypothetical protein